MASNYPTVYYGSYGETVKQLQQALNQVGYSLDVDGGFGEKTRAAVLDYQRKNGLRVDGVAGSETMGSLLARLTPATSGPSTSGQVLSGVSDETMSRMRQLEKGYTPSDEVTAARALWESLQGQKPGEYESRFQQQLAGHIAIGRGQLEATAPKRLKTGGKKPIIIIGVIVAVLLAAYVGLCAYANSLDIFYPNTTINRVDVAGLTAEQAAERLRQEIPEETVEFYLPLADETGDGESAPEGDMLYGADPDAVCTYRELGITEELDYEVSAQSAFDAVQGRSSFFVKGWEYLACLVGADGQLGVVLEPEEDIFQVKMEQLSEQFSREAQDASYEVTEDAVEITKALNGLSVSAADLARTAQERWTGSGNGAAASVFVNNARILPAKTLTAQEIYDDCSGVVKNASYDKETGAIVPEEAGADFDVDEAQRLLDAAAPGETVTVPAQVELPAVTAEELEQVLFRDVLGEARTHVGGTSARRSNVKLSAASINEYVMNSGDVFSYNDVVGQRTAARGYQAAPAYVQGETVDEIGGGICQTSSTLYLACLRSNLEITERYAHRYVPAYITAGMDATVSWGGPDYKFTNNSLYPIKIVTIYENNYLTVRILGTNVDGTSVKMTNEHLSTTPYETVYEDDPTLAPGTEKVKTTPYTGYKYRTYRNVYDANGKLISSTYEATSDYKSRNKGWC